LIAYFFPSNIPTEIIYSWEYLAVKKEHVRSKSIKQTINNRYTYRNRNFDNLPNESGIGPVNRFKYRSKLTKLVRFPKSLGIGPVMLLLYSSLL
jgi:hypothetical protein